MKKYKFIIKPLLFVFNLLFATWLVFAIEAIKPTDFGRYEYLFEDPPVVKTRKQKKEHLIRISSEYKKGIIDTTELVRQIDMYLALPSEKED